MYSPDGRQSRRTFQPTTPRSAAQHNPYIGSFHRNRRFLAPEGIFLPNSSPHVGTFRHAPGRRQRQGLKEILWEGPATTNIPVVSRIQYARKKTLASRHISKQDLKDIPMSLFEAASEVSPSDAPICPICLDPFADGDEIRELQCRHCFHSNCVDIWLLGTLSDEATVTNICPTCRQAATTSNTDVSTEEQEIAEESFYEIGEFIIGESKLDWISVSSSPKLSPWESPKMSPWSSPKDTPSSTPKLSSPKLTPVSSSATIDIAPIPRLPSPPDSSPYDLCSSTISSPELISDIELPQSESD